MVRAPGPPSTAAVFAPAAKPCCRRAQVAPSTAAPTCRWSGWPSGERPRNHIVSDKLCPVHHRPSRHRCLSTAGDTPMGISSALQQAGPRPAAFGATKAIRPAALEQEPSATRFIRKSAVEIRGARAASWPWRRIMTARPPRIQRNLGQRDKPLREAHPVRSRIGLARFRRAEPE